MKTFSKFISLIVMRWCGSMSQYGVCTVCCTELCAMQWSKVQWRSKHN